MKKIFVFFLGAGIGGLLCSTLVLLLTPYKGQELRVLARQSIEKVQSEVQKAAAEKRLELEAELSRLRSQQA
jgi:gas vesicle protein